MTLPNETESVEYQIRLDAIVALQNLAELTNATKSFNTQMEAATMTTKNFAQQWGMNFQQAKSTLAGVDKEISGTTESSVIFGARGQEAWNKVGEASQKSSQTMVGSINLVRTALHVLVTSAIFSVIAAFTQLFSMAIKGLRELETATYNLVNAERALSEQGVEITPKGLDETIKKLQQIDPLLSRIQATEVVSRVSSLVAPSVGFNAKEIDQLSQAIAVLAVRNKGLGKSFEEVESQVSNAFLSGRVSVGINQLGVKITDQIVKDEALRLGLVKTGNEFDNLTGKMEANVKARAMLSVLTQNTNKEIGHLPDYLKTADAQFGIFQARLQDILTIVGKDFGPVLIRLFQLLTYSIMGWIDVLEKVGPVIQKVVAYVVATSKALEVMFAQIGKPFQKGAISGAFQDSLKESAKYFEDFASAADTATGAASSFSSATNNMAKATAEAKDKLAELSKEMQDKAADLERQYGQKKLDIATNYSDKISDINRKASQKRTDAETDLSNKLSDINRDTSEKIASAQQDYRQKEIDREKEKNDKLKELRRKFLMDLEDALRERDARAVLKLIRNYNAEKKAAEEANKQQAQQNKVELQRKLQDIEIERQQKIDAARREYADKLKEIELARQRELAEAATWKQRELRDAQIWHQRQLEEQRIYLQRKLRDLADAIAKEYQLTAVGMASIYRLMQTYLGANGSLLSGFNTSLSGSLNNIVSGGTSTTSSGFGSTNSGFGTHTGQTTYNPYDIRSRGFAEGGTLLATRPTTVTFGETPEIATFAPITRQGADVNKLFTSGGNKDTGGGLVNIALKLSPDLRAEILDSTLDNVAVHLERLSRSE